MPQMHLSHKVINLRRTRTVCFNKKKYKKIMPNRKDNATVKSQHSCVSGRACACAAVLVPLYSSLRVW